MADEQTRSADREVPATSPEGPGRSSRGVFAAVAVAAVLIVLWWLFTRGGTAERLDLIAAYETARKQPEPSVFTIGDVTLNGESKRSVSTAAVPGTRLTYTIQVPEDGWFFVSLGLKPEAWEQDGDGVNFTVGISDGRSYDELMSHHVNPYGDPTNRRWIPVYVDISAYGGEQVDLILNTRSGPPGKEGDVRNDLAVWGAPEVLVR